MIPPKNTIIRQINIQKEFNIQMYTLALTVKITNNWESINGWYLSHPKINKPKTMNITKERIYTTVGATPNSPQIRRNLKPTPPPFSSPY